MTYLSGLASATALVLQPIDRLSSGDPRIAALTSAGLHSYSSAPCGGGAHAACAREVAFTAPVFPRKQIDAVILASESFGAFSSSDPPTARAARQAILSALAALGRHSSYVYGNWLTGCGNLSASIELARCPVTTEPQRRVAVVMVDVFADEERVMQNGAAIDSDAAAACVVSNQATSAPHFKLVSVALTANLQGVVLESAGPDAAVAVHVATCCC